jgi:hypothetical protein
VALAVLALGVALSWTAPGGCPGEAALREDVEALLGRSLNERFARWVDVRAVVTRAAGRFVLEVSGDGSGGPFTRRLEDASCDALAEAAALIVAIAIDPAVMEAPAEAGGEPGGERFGDPRVEPGAGPRAEPGAERGAGPRAEPRADGSADRTAAEPPIEYVDPIEREGRSPLPFGLPWPRLGVSVLGGLDGGLRDRAGGSALVALAIFWSYLRFEASTGYWFARDDVSIISAGGRICPTLPWVIEASLCAGVELGQLRADPEDAPARRRFWGAGTGAIGIAWAPAELVAIRASGELVLSVFRPSYLVNATGETDRPSLVAGRGIFGIELRFF